MVTLYHPPPPPSLFDPHFKRLHDFFLLEPLKNRFGDVITHGARERELTTGAGIACICQTCIKAHLIYSLDPSYISEYFT